MVIGGRYWEPQEDGLSPEEQDRNWAEFLEWAKTHNLDDPQSAEEMELPFL